MNKDEHEMEKELIELKHMYKLEEIDIERKSKIEVERLHHENALGEIRFKKASIELSRGRKR